LVSPEPRLLIGGELREGATSFPIINPATEQVIGHAPDATDSDVDDAVAAARHAFDETSWPTDRAFRARCLRQLQAALESGFADLQELTVAEAGAPVIWTEGPQLRTPIEGLGYLADVLESYQSRQAGPPPASS
jgi:aldehyde dehydrogenase (NAD+)